MTPASLARRNVRQNLKNFLLYFVAAVFAVFVFNVFTSVFFTAEIQTVAEKNSNVRAAMQVSAVMVALFAAMFIWYSSSVFLKARNKELGLYLLLGLRHREIGWMLFYENMMLGAAAVTLGTVLGSLFAKLFAMLLVRLMGIDAIVGLVISVESVLATVGVFALLFLLVSLRGVRTVYRMELVDLLHAAQKGERQPRASVLAGLLSLVLIGAAYWILMTTSTDKFLANLLYIVPLMIVGTYLFFRSLIVLVLNRARNKRGFLYKGVNLISLSHLLFRIRGNTLMLTTITLLTVMTLTAVGGAYGTYRSTESGVLERMPFTFMYRHVDPVASAQAEELFKPYQADITFQADVDWVQVPYELKPGGPGQSANVISVSTYNELVQVVGRMEPVNLRGGETLLLQPLHLKRGASTGAQALLPNAAPLQVIAESSERLWNEFSTWTTFVVQDELYAQFEAVAQTAMKRTARVVQMTDSLHRLTLSEQLQAVMPQMAWLDSQPQKYEEAYQTNGMMIFIGGFIGSLFLLATGSILYFKQLMDAQEDRPRYAVLQKIGMNRREVRMAVQKQLGLLFALPVLVALVHSSIVLTRFGEMAKQPLLGYGTIVMFVYVLVYAGFYRMTVRSFTGVMER